MNLPIFFLGGRRIRAKSGQVTALLNLCMTREINFTEFRAETDGGVSFSCSLPAARKLFRLCREQGLEITSSAYGLPIRLWERRNRSGLIVGALFAMALLILSTRFLWSVRITGNSRLTSGEILRELSEEGLEIGAYLPDLHLGEIETRVLTASEDLAWISIRLEGTVAMVQVVERVAKPEKKTAPANLVAARDGQIELLELYRGKPVVRIGEPVREGQLLVSGIYDSNTVGFRYTRAAGRVLARTERDYTVEIPLQYEKKEVLSEEQGGFILQFFNFSLKFLKSTGNDPSLCDIIERKTSPDRFGLPDLPVSLTYRTYRNYAFGTAERTREDALALAWEELGKQLESLSGDVQLLRKETAVTMTESAVILQCRITCIENIARQTEIEIAEP